MYRKQATVTNEGWFVSGSSPAYATVDGEYKKVGGFRLHVHRYIGPGTGMDRKQLRGDGDGRIFKDTDEGFAWALTRGYLQSWYRRTWCPKHRTLHFWIGAPHGPQTIGDLECWRREDRVAPRRFLKRLAEQTAWLIRHGSDLSRALYQARHDLDANTGVDYRAAA